MARWNFHAPRHLAFRVTCIPAWPINGTGHNSLIYVPSGKRLKKTMENHNLRGKSTISMAIFNSKLFVYQRVLLIISG